MPCSAHHSANPCPESGRVRSNTRSALIRPERQIVASTRPQAVTLRFCSDGSRSTNAGCVARTATVKVLPVGSWIMPAPVSGSAYSRSRAMSPGRASVPAGLGVTIRRR